jgi:type II secretory pathway pseudopilin PulG
MIVVTAIVSLFAVGIVAVINPTQQVRKANDARRKSDLNTLQRGLEAYYHDTGRYPLASGYKVAPSGTALAWGSTWSPYMNTLPKDPNSSQSYIYYVSADGQSYIVYASLEKASTDPQSCNSGAACTTLSSRSIATNACGGTCNYAVASPDINP